MEPKKRSLLIIVLIIAILAVVLLVASCTNRSRMDHAESTEPTVPPVTTGMDTGHSSHQTDSAVQNSSQLDSYMKEQDTIMADMMKGMNAVQSTGNASVHFLKGMIPHHESAIDMAESYLKYGGQNQDLKTIAQAIIDAQTKEIDDMNTMIADIEASGKTDTAKEEGYLKEYVKMMTAHENDHSHHGTPANVEQAFAEGMIMHHQMAVEMAQAILDYTDEESVRRLAAAIVSTQEKEIKEMQDIIENVK